MPTLTIPGVEVVHPVEEWVEPCFPMTGPVQSASLITAGVLHYTAALDLPDGDIGEFDYQIVPFLRAANRDYWLNRDNGNAVTIACGRTLEGYALGYCWAVDWLGGAWELRGWKYRAAATNGHNVYTMPILLLTDRADFPSEMMQRTTRAILRECRRRSGRSQFRGRPFGHGELKTLTGIGTATACPGNANMAVRDLGRFDLDFPDDDNPSGDPDMHIPWKSPVRAYDSRPTEQGHVDPTLRQANADLVGQMGPMAPFTSRQVFVGLANAASVVVHSVGLGGAGFIKVTGEPAPCEPSLINWNDAAPVRDCSVSVGLTSGSIWVHNGPTPADFIVEVTDRW